MILNLTQHPATPEQLATGLRDLPPADAALLHAYLTFDSPPSRHETQRRAALIADLALGACPTDEFVAQALIGGAPWLMSSLELALYTRGFSPVYSFSVRSSTVQAQPDGSVQKVSVFKHVAYVEA